jgi:hypothetical protein
MCYLRTKSIHQEAAMKRLVIGIIAAWLAMFFWGSLYWATTKLPYSAWKSAPDDLRAGQALKEQFPESGTYYVPSMSHPTDKLEKLMKQGPVGFVHINREGRPMMDPSIMGMGAAHNLVVVILLAILLTQARLGSWGARARFVSVVAVAAAIMVDFGDAIWWGTSWGWKLATAGYTVSSMTVAGLVLAKFVED